MLYLPINKHYLSVEQKEELLSYADKDKSTYLIGQELCRTYMELNPFDVEFKYEYGKRYLGIVNYIEEIHTIYGLPIKMVRLDFNKEEKVNKLYEKIIINR